MTRGKNGGRGVRAYAIPLAPFAGREPGGFSAAPDERGGWRDQMNLQERMNHLFGDAARRHAHLAAEQADATERADWTPAADVYETQDAFVVALDLPGIDRAALEVTVDDNRLTVRGARAAEEGAQHRRGNRPVGRFVSGFGPLPPSVDQRNIAAEYKDGVLRLRLPKRAADGRGRVRIEIK